MISNIFRLIFFQTEREKTKGKEWFGMPVGEMSEENKNDLTIIKLRGGLHKDRFYKANDSDNLPKFFQVTNKKTVQVYFSKQINKLTILCLIDG